MVTFAVVIETVVLQLPGWANGWTPTRKDDDGVDVGVGCGATETVWLGVCVGAADGGVVAIARLRAWTDAPAEAAVPTSINGIAATDAVSRTGLWLRPTRPSPRATTP